MNNYEFIKEFQNIKLSNICKKYNINLGNLLSGQTTEENFKKVKNEIIKNLLDLLVNSKSEYLVTLALYDEVIMKLERENKNLREMI